MSWEQWLSALGAAGFGALIGWFVYYINRYRKGDVQFSDLTTVIAIIGGGVVIQLFSTPWLFGAYGIGLFLGFFGYFVAMLLLIRASPNFDADFLLDGRRRNLDGVGYYIPGDQVRPAMMPEFPMLGGPQAMMAAQGAPASPLAEETRQAQASAAELRSATLEAQRAIGALALANSVTGARMTPNADPASPPGS